MVVTRPARGLAVTKASGRVGVYAADMGDKLIDDAVPETAGSLGRAAPGERAQTGAGANKAPPRERTILGVAPSQEVGAPVAPVLVPPPPREETVLGVGMEGAVARAAPEVIPPPAGDPSIVIDLSVRRPESEPSLVPAGVPRRSRAIWVWLVVLAASAAGGYWRREQVRPWLITKGHQVSAWVRTHR
jgi:hypothetical protein